ncbi:MAG: NifB/NifX family molybdenum-iron cluster-binding protein [Candidatus Tantalella remota]|nr:NifB/NifX family molybdenum-iron cluster-binding protein [Candidatus Tantalella remota]
MKICITSQGNNLEAQLDPRFGRCQYFVIVDTDTDAIDVLENPNKDGMGGVGVQSGQSMAEKQVKVVLTGNVGPNAYQTLNAAGIEVITGVTGTIKEVLDKYKKGEFKSTQGPSVDSHFGTE